MYRVTGFLQTTVIRGNRSVGRTSIKGHAPQTINQFDFLKTVPYVKIHNRDFANQKSKISGRYDEFERCKNRHDYT